VLTFLRSAWRTTLLLLGGGLVTARRVDHFESEVRAGPSSREGGRARVAAASILKSTAP
jgi:hypothetical protein